MFPVIQGVSQQHHGVQGMTSKEIAIKTIEQLPEDATWEDIQERINFVAGVRKGLRELADGKGIPHETVKQEFSEWLLG